MSNPDSLSMEICSVTVSEKSFLTCTDTGVERK